VLGILYLSGACGLEPGALAAPALTAAETTFFESKIRPVLSQSCYQCHSAEATKVKGGLLLDTRDGVLKGGDNGPAIVPGNPEKSLLIKAVRYADPDRQMPPKGEKLSDAQIADLVAWVKRGAPDPRIAKLDTRNSKPDATSHWSFQPVKNPSVPRVQAGDRVANPIDPFVIAKLEEQGMKMSPATDKRTLIRRVSFDLIWLPPSLEEMQPFLEDRSPKAFEKVVDRLLAMPQYGERWGRHWLDVARYADTKGEVRRQRDTALSVRLDLSRLRHQGIQRRQTLRPIHHRTDRGGQTAAGKERSDFGGDGLSHSGRAFSRQRERHHQRPH
jgi:cytochrome c553